MEFEGKRLSEETWALWGDQNEGIPKNSGYYEKSHKDLFDNKGFTFEMAEEIFKEFFREEGCSVCSGFSPFWGKFGSFFYIKNQENLLKNYGETWWFDSEHHGLLSLFPGIFLLLSKAFSMKFNSFWRMSFMVTLKLYFSLPSSFNIRWISSKDPQNLSSPYRSLFCGWETSCTAKWRPSSMSCSPSFKTSVFIDICYSGSFSPPPRSNLSSLSLSLSVSWKTSALSPYTHE